MVNQIVRRPHIATKIAYDNVWGQPVLHKNDPVKEIYIQDQTYNINFHCIKYLRETGRYLLGTLPQKSDESRRFYQTRAQTRFCETLTTVISHHV